MCWRVEVVAGFRTKESEESISMPSMAKLP